MSADDPVELSPSQLDEFAAQVAIEVINQSNTPDVEATTPEKAVDRYFEIRDLNAETQQLTNQRSSLTSVSGAIPSPASGRPIARLM